MSTELTQRDGELQTSEPMSEMGQMIMAAIAQPDFDIEKFKALLHEKRIEEDRERERSFLRAKKRFLKDCPPIPFDKQATTPGAKWKYASLGAIRRVIDPVLSKHGLSYRWEEREGRKVCILSHEEGHSEEASFTLSIDGQQGGLAKMTQQHREGAADTYAKSRTLCSVCGISAEEDTGGAGTETPGKPAEQQTHVDRVESIKHQWRNRRHEIPKLDPNEQRRRFAAWFMETTGAPSYSPVADRWTPEQIEACERQLAKEQEAHQYATEAINANSDTSTE